MSVQNIVSVLNGLNNITAIKSPECMYFCKIQNEDNSVCWGFLSPSDERLENALVKVEVSIEQHQQLLSGGNIVYYDGEVFNAEENEYYLDENQNFVKRDKSEYDSIKANETRAELVQTLYNMKAQKAYGGVIINNALVFETNQTAVTNTVATLALMNDNDTSSWKFYSINGEPIMQTVNKAQLFTIASFGRKMIDDSFKVEGEYLATLENATVQNLVSKTWVDSFVEDAQADFDAVENKLNVPFS
jgi:hypothetical protein